jgi:hypothetical protein
MKAFLTSLVVVIAIGLGSDYLFGGPVFNTGGVIKDSRSATANISPNVRLPGQEVGTTE